MRCNTLGNVILFALDLGARVEEVTAAAFVVLLEAYSSSILPLVQIKQILTFPFTVLFFVRALANFRRQFMGKSKIALA